MFKVDTCEKRRTDAKPLEIYKISLIHKELESWGIETLAHTPCMARVGKGLLSKSSFGSRNRFRCKHFSSHHSLTTSRLLRAAGILARSSALVLCGIIKRLLWGGEEDASVVASESTWTLAALAVR